MNSFLRITLPFQVRQKYFDFLEKLLADNYENSVTGAVLSCQDIKKCAEYLVSYTECRIEFIVWIVRM